MTRKRIAVFAAGEQARRTIADKLSDVEFEHFFVEVHAGGSELKVPAIAKAIQSMAGQRDKPLLLIGAGFCRSLNPGFTSGSAVASDSSFLNDQELAQDLSGLLVGGISLPAAGLEIKSPSDLAASLAGKGFWRGSLVTAGRWDQPENANSYNALAMDGESALLALLANDRGIPWLNIRVAAEACGLDSEAANFSRADLLEVLSLKLLVALSTYDQMGPPSACAGCSNPCGIFTR